MTPTVAVDMEETLAYTHPAFLTAYNREFGTGYELRDIQSYDWVRDEIEFNDFMRIVDELWVTTPTTIPPIATEPRLQTAFSELARETTFDIVTARTGGDYPPQPSDKQESVSAGMKAWLEYYGLTAFEDFYAVDHSKADLEYTYFIDDSPILPENLREHQHVYLPRQPHNQDVRDHPQVTPVDDVPEAVQLLLTQETV